MSTNKTENLGLNQWVRSDPFRMADFNEDNAKIDKAVAAKAEQAALDAEAAARKSADDTKAPIASPTFTGTPKAPTASSGNNSTQIATTAFVTTAVNALAGRVGTLEADKLLWKFGTYTGKGGAGASSPTRIELPFKPALLIVSDPIASDYGGYPWLYGDSYGRSYSGSLGSVALSWNEQVVEFWVFLSSGTANQQLNVQDREYRYFAIGIQE